MPRRGRARLPVWRVAVALSAGILAFPAFADNTLQFLPFGQNWADTGLITTSDIWSSVPGILGYRGDDLTTATGTDPQTILADGSGTPIDVNPNQTNPAGFATGGVAEFEGPNPTVALQGSGTADAPHIVLHLDTSGHQGVRIQYNLRDLDDSPDNAVQAVALQFRVGGSGNFTNVPAGFVADATTGPNIATQVTAVNVVLPPSASNQPLVQVRIITTNAVGNDEWVGVDDIQASSSTTFPSGTGAASPSTAAPGQSTLLTVTVTPGSNPPSTGIQVTADLSAIGGSITQTFFDDGTGADVSAGDNVFSFLATVAMGTTGGQKSLPASISDAQARIGAAAIDLTVQAEVGVTPAPGAALRLNVSGPNPASRGVWLRYETLEEPTHHLDVYDIGGRLVRPLASGPLPAGNHEVFWDGRDRAAQVVQSGVYLVRLETRGTALMRRVVIRR